MRVIDYGHMFSQGQSNRRQSHRVDAGRMLPLAAELGIRVIFLKDCNEEKSPTQTMGNLWNFILGDCNFSIIGYI